VGVEVACVLSHLIECVGGAFSSGQKLAGDIQFIESIDQLCKEKCPATWYAAARLLSIPLIFAADSIVLFLDSAEDMLKADVLHKAFQHRVARLLASTARFLHNQVQKEGRSFADAWNAALIDVAALSAAYCMYYLISTFIQSVESLGTASAASKASASTSTSLVVVLRRLYCLFAVSTILEEADFFYSAYFTPQQVSWLQQSRAQLLTAIRPDAVALTDAFDVTDFELNSAIAMKAGDAYRQLYEWARDREPLNRTLLPPNFENTLAPLVRAKL
jgi:hypothetical protein